MDGDGIAALAAAVGQCVPTPGSCLRLGTVERSGGGDLAVRCRGLLLEGEDLLVSALLNYSWKKDLGEPNLLRAGDFVILFTEDDQLYYLVSRVLPAGGGGR